MLVLSRKVDEQIAIGIDGTIANPKAITLTPDILITVVAIQENQVQFGIEAPDHIFIHRGEVLDKINAGLIEAAQEDAEQFGGKDGEL